MKANKKQFKSYRRVQNSGVYNIKEQYAAVRGSRWI